MRALRAGWRPGVLTEALLLEEPDPGRWSEQLLEAASSVFEVPSLSVVWACHTSDFLPLELKAFGHRPRVLSQAFEEVEGLATVVLRRLCEPGPRLINIVRRLRWLPLTSALDVVARLGLSESYSIRTFPRPGLTLSLSWGSERGGLQHSARDLQLLKRFSMHLEVALRLREVPAVEGALDANGHLLDDNPSTPEVVWTALRSGRVSVAPRSHGSARHFLLVPNPLAQRLDRALSPTECALCERLTRGEQAKVVALELGLSAPALSRALTSAVSRLGFQSAFEALRVLGGLLEPARAAAGVALTPAERDVLALVRAGYANADIARLRKRSTNTIANQVASLLRKTGLPGRRALAVRG
jgi:DNA-binding NarL/FixJ family response regulator